jgi:phosphoribosyl 1,2-cyclic phosphate phosphodiesterase
VALGLPEGNVLIDTPPELRVQLTRERIGLIHAVLYTHAHADHLFGLDDLRILPRYLGHDVPIYCEVEVEEVIRRAFHYAFDPVARSYPAGGLPRLGFRRITTDPFHVLGVQVVPLRMVHGHARVLGFRFGGIAYCTDTKEIPPESEERLQGLDVLILDGLRHEPHVTHLSVEEALAVVERLRPRRTFLTHLSHRLEHETTNRSLPSGVELAYDGLRIPLRLA